MHPLDVRRPFTRAEALAAGLTDAQLRGPRFQRLFTGVHLCAAVVVTPRLRIEAALRLHPPGSFVSHASAARIHGLAVPDDAEEHVTVRQRGHRRRTAGVRCHLSSAEVETVTVGGLLVSTPAQAFVELASSLGLVDLVVVGDQMARRGLLCPDGLRAACARSTLRGAVSARRAAAFVRDRVDSPMESRLRMLLVLAGLPEPEVNVVVRDVDGTPLRRYDLSFPAARVAVEYDGRHHVERIEQWERDLDRREALEDDGWRLLVVTSSGVFRRPGETVRRVHRLLRARGVPGVPVRSGDAWRQHFRGQE
ncbi:DUF559 domain-containing protein [Nocardioides solisilvae]|uniref:DUF559 domain-containing protein n=1 Tax=Nocardioides solisilvae TaxID=1542435 RepID=UPI0013A539D6|nr:DUF559 domain-containing protein [Nocardioides solisilvae]